MKQGIAFGLLGLLALASGCAAPARYVEKQADSGVIAIPADTDTWPNYNRRAALELIQKHVGPNFVIVDQREVVTGTATTNNQQVNTEQTMNQSNPFLPAQRQTVTNTTTQSDIREFRIWYRRSQPGVVNSNQRAMPNGVAPAGGPGPDIVPSVMPAGAAAPTTPTGYPTSYFSPRQGAGTDKC